MPSSSVPPVRRSKREHPAMSCSNCGCDLSAHYKKRPCPWCGMLPRTFRIRGEPDASADSTKAFYEHHPGLLAAQFGLAVVFAEGGYLFIGPLFAVVSLVLSTVGMFVIPKGTVGLGPAVRRCPRLGRLPTRWLRRVR